MCNNGFQLILSQSTPLVTQAKGIVAHMLNGRVEMGCILADHDCHDGLDYLDLDGRIGGIGWRDGNRSMDGMDKTNG